MTVDELQAKVDLVLQREIEAADEAAGTLVEVVTSAADHVARVTARTSEVAAIRRPKGKSLGAATRAGLVDLQQRLRALDAALQELQQRGGGQ